MKWSADPRILRQPVHFLAFGFGAGLAPKAPGTFGTLVAVPIVACVMHFGGQVHVSFTVAAFLAGIWICGESARRLGVHDHSGIVWDEIVGFSVTMLAAPPNWYWLVTGFVLFRLFDIWKPYPIRLLDANVKGGLGVMVDDLFAAFYAYLAFLAFVFVMVSLGFK